MIAVARELGVLSSQFRVLIAEPSCFGGRSIMSAFLPDTLLTREEGAARLRYGGYRYAGDALAAGIAGPRFVSHGGVLLFRWGDLALWAAERREEESLGNTLAMFEDPATMFSRAPEEIRPRPDTWINAGTAEEAAAQ
jgi:hypothetical protein